MSFEWEFAVIFGLLLINGDNINSKVEVKPVFVWNITKYVHFSLGSLYYTESCEVLICIVNSQGADMLNSFSCYNFTFCDLCFLREIEEIDISLLITSKEVVEGATFTFAHWTQAIEFKSSLRWKFTDITLVVRIFLILFNFKDLIVNLLENLLLQDFVDKSVGLRELVLQIFRIAILPVV